jgi:hypothetical protein
MNSLDSTVTLPISTNSTYYRTVQDSGRIYLLFSDGIIVVAENATMETMTFIEFGMIGTVIGVFSMDVCGDTLAYSIGSLIVISKEFPFSANDTLFSQTWVTPIDDIRLLPNYLIIATYNSLIQFDLDLFV